MPSPMIYLLFNLFYLRLSSQSYYLLKTHCCFIPFFDKKKTSHEDRIFYDDVDMMVILNETVRRKERKSLISF